MDPQYVQNLRYKLQKRIRRLNSVDVSAFIMSLRQFWRFFDGDPTYVSITELLMARFPNAAEDVNKSFTEKGLFGESEDEAAALGYAMLRRLANEDNHMVLLNLARRYGQAAKPNEALEFVSETFLEPLYEYVDEHLDDQRAMLGLLLRYKHRSEWFHRDHLWQLTQSDSRNAEKSLALDLYSYLHDQGIDFTIEPSSLTGEIDLIAAQGSSDLLLADTKIFDADSRGKHYIRKGFNQIYTYTQQYNEPFGYLVIFKTTDKDLRFSFSTQSRDIPVVVYNHKTIFLITIDIFLHPKSVSQRDPLRVIEITEEELCQTIVEVEPQA
jgi:hypothetical protein